MRLTLAIALSVMTATTAAAQDRSETMAMQSRLALGGFYTVDIDGLGGPAMRQALADYASENGVDPDFRSVARHMAIDTIETRQAPDETELALARDHVRDHLRDGPAARFRGEYVIRGEKAIAICGEVNGKNAYGAYTGFQPYSVSVSVITSIAVDNPYLMTGPPDFDYAATFCGLGATLFLGLAATH